MSWFSSIVLFIVIWFVTLFCVLPFGMTTQGERGNTVAGTSPSAPEGYNFKRALLTTCLIAFLVWAIIVGSFVYFGITVFDIDPFKWMGIETPYN